jgi:hypothetical protein
MSSKKIAVLYTGEIRTIENTSPYFRKNILDPTNADIFAIIQGTISNQAFETILIEHWRSNLKSFDWFYREHYNDLQDRLIENMNLPFHWQYYLKTSGSMVEYYQLYLAFQKMREYEERNGFKYDFVIRLRTDVLITRPLDFSIFDEPEKRWKQVGQSLPLFFSSLFSLERVQSDQLIEIQGPPNTDKIQEYLTNGEYLVTIRKNVFYFGKRNVFEKIASLGITYGHWKSPKYDHWFDAESQLHTICEKKGVDVFDSMTQFEGESLYQYRSENYFDSSGNLLNNSSVFCFILREPSGSHPRCLQQNPSLG